MTIDQSDPTRIGDEKQTHSNRVDLKPGSSWTRQVVERILTVFPDLDTYTVAAGISPSGTVHIGNLRDVMISKAVATALQAKRKKVRFVFSWDNFDRFRKVPANVPPSWKEHIGKPLSKVPDPSDTYSSYAEFWQHEFESALAELDIEVEYRYQTAQYESGTYDQEMLLALDQRKTIAETLLQSMSKKAIADKGIDSTKYVEEFCPLSIYSRSTGKDNTTYVRHEGSLVTYLCRDTGQVDTVDITREHIAKLGWKVDWPMRWKHEGVVFEPGGKDHASPGGSYDVSSELAGSLFGIQAPIFVGYEFIGVQGLKGKMSGSAGNSITPKKLLEIYEPGMIHSLYNKRAPNVAFNFAFDAEVTRQYDEYDRERAAGSAEAPKPIPFRQAVALGQIVQWDTARLDEILAMTGQEHDATETAARAVKAKNWLETYNPAEAIQVRNVPNDAYWQTVAPEARRQIHTLKQFLIDTPDATIAEIEETTYQIPREAVGTDQANMKNAQRSFFKDVYNLLIGKDTGPRLGTFLYVLDRSRIVVLLTL